MSDERTYYRAEVETRTDVKRVLMGIFWTTLSPQKTHQVDLVMSESGANRYITLLSNADGHSVDYLVRVTDYVNA